MENSTVIENIEKMRRREGIDDVELRDEIRTLAVGDFVKLTFLSRTKTFAHETLLVRIAGIDSHAFRGVLAESPTSNGLSGLEIGSSVVFTADHIHSLPKEQPAHGK